MSDDKNPNLLAKTSTYLVGHMQYVEGRDWREQVEAELEPLGIKLFNPYKKPFVKDVDEDEDVREFIDRQMRKGYYSDVSERMKQVRSYDLNLVDRSDFIIAHLVPEVASWGSAEELVSAARMKKPVFVSMEGGKQKTPLWIMGMIPHHYVYDSVEEIIEMIKEIDKGNKPIDSDRWRLLKKKFR
jgi:nucleoside 2-deoxyribosyltransferase